MDLIINSRRIYIYIYIWVPVIENFDCLEELVKFENIVGEK